MSKANVHYDLGSCTISVPKIPKSDFTYSNTVGYTHIGLIPNGATKFDFIVDAFTVGYTSTNSQLRFNDITMPSSSNEVCVYLPADPDNLYGSISYGDYVNKKHYYVIFWEFRNNAGYLEVYSCKSPGDSSSTTNGPFKVLSSITPSAPHKASLTVRFH